MGDSIIDKLLLAIPDARIEIIQKLYKKNRDYFAVEHPGIDHILQNLQNNPYQIHLTEDFLEIVSVQDSESYGGAVALDVFARSLGDWSHNAWIEFLDPKLQKFSEDSWHVDTVRHFNQTLNEAFPGVTRMAEEGRVSLPVSDTGRCFSNSVIFTGVFAGLHIAHFLSRTDISNVAFIEPDAYRFEVSLYFLDYASIAALTNGLLLHVGEGLPDEFLDVAIHKAFVSSNVWLRVLPGYASERIEPIVTKIRLKWLSISDAWVSGERELQAIRNGLYNLEKQRLLLGNRPQLSRYSRIAVIGAGPSLTDDLDWLKKNQKKLILFAAHSSVRLLKENGIVPDFQFALDIDWTDEMDKQLQLDTEIPFVVNYQTAPDRIARFKNVYLVAGETIAPAANVSRIVPYMYPTTGNMVFAFAHYCRPAEIFLLGLDLAFRSTDRLHVKGSHYDDKSRSVEKQVTERIEVKANFEEKEPVLTKGYYDLARTCIENALSSSSCGTVVYNMSDGAFIQGSVPRHSDTVELPVYLMKKTDVDALRRVFEKSEQGKNWNFYDVPGDVLLQTLKKRTREVLFLERFSHKEFTVMVDNCQFLVNKACRDISKDDGRMIPYLRVVRDMLLSWYRFMLFAHSPDEIKAVYEIGCKTLVDCVDHFEWNDYSKQSG